MELLGQRFRKVILHKEREITVYNITIVCASVTKTSTYTRYVYKMVPKIVSRRYFKAEANTPFMVSLQMSDDISPPPSEVTIPHTRTTNGAL